MALVIDLSFMLPRLDLISSSSSAGLTKWNTLSSSNRALPTGEGGGGTQHFELSCHISASYLFMHTFTEHIEMIEKGGCQLNLNAEKKKWEC